MTTRAVQVSTIPSIEIFVRHSSACPRRDDPEYKKCNCPKHLRYTHNGKQYRQSAKTRAWKIAEERRRKIEAQFEAADPTKPISAVTVEAKGGTTIGQAIDLFVSDKRSQNVSAEVLKKYERELDRLKEFMAKRSKFFPNEISVGDLTEFRSGWITLYPSSTTRSKVQERLRGFLRYCLASNLITRIPVLSPIQVTTPPAPTPATAPFSRLIGRSLVSAALTVPSTPPVTPPRIAFAPI
jgi:integrase/recombinase XerD